MGDRALRKERRAYAIKYYSRTPIPELMVSTPCLNGGQRVAGNDDDWEETNENPLTVVIDEPSEGNTMELLAGSVDYHLWHAIGGAPPLRMNTQSKGAPNVPMVRAAMNVMLLDVNERLAQHGCKLLVGEAMRLPRIQRKLWCLDFAELSGGKEPEELTATEWVRIGMAADVCSVPVAVNRSDPRFKEVWERLVDQYRNVMSAVEIQKLVKWQANLGLNGLSLNEHTTTPHGSGGAVDVALVDSRTGDVKSLGVPHGYTFDETNRVCWMRFFEEPGCDDEYRRVFHQHEPLRAYLAYYGQTKSVSDAFIAEVRASRRILYHAMTDSGASHYFKECWHFNGMNAKHPKYPGAGSVCHSLCAPYDPWRDENGKVIGIWGNPTAIAQAERLVLAHATNLDIGFGMMSKTNQ